MIKLSRLVAIATLGLTLFSCDKSESIKRNVENKLSEPQCFEMSSSLGAVGLEELSNNTNELSPEELRATLHFKDVNSVATTTLKATAFGTGKREARWGVVYDGGKNYALNCEDAISAEPTDASAVSKNTVFFKESSTVNTIKGAALKMYCRSLTSLSNITQGIMLLDGKAGIEPNSTKQYFKGETSPNHRIEGLIGNSFQDNRHIPIMTDVVPFVEMTKPLAKTQVKFAPRGSLIGLSINNTTNEQMIITAIVVKKENALDFTGYFDWTNLETRTETQGTKTVTRQLAKFTPEYETTEGTALSFPVYSNTAVGYTLAQNTQACFYVWGYQNKDRKGSAFEVQIRYKTTPTGAEQTTRTFNVFAPNSKIETGVKQFDDSYSYNTILTVDDSNKAGGSNGLDWKDGGVLPNGNNPNVPDPSTAQCQDIRSVSLNFTTPLDFVAEMPAINKAGTGFVQNHCLPHTNVVADIYDTEVGYYTFNQALALFDGTKPFLTNYYLPSKEQWQSIVPYEYGPTGKPVYLSHFGKTYQVIQNAQVGETPPQEYTSDYSSIRDSDGSLAAYALRFKGTEWVSAWRYSYDRNTKKMTVKCVPLKERPNDQVLSIIAKPEFFINNACTIRVFPAYGFRYHRDYGDFSDSDVDSFGTGIYWSSTPIKSGQSYTMTFFSNYGAVGIEDANKLPHYFTVRPFVRRP